MKCKAIIFDLDGVIVHTDELHYLGWKKLSDRLGIYFDRHINNRCRGVSRMESLDIVLERSCVVYTEQEKMDFAEEKNAYYRELLNDMSPADVAPDVRIALNDLKAKGYKLAIGSSSKNARLILDRVRLADFFYAVADGNDISNSKPDPEVFIKAADFLRETPGSCAVIEDAIAGVEAGKNCGMLTIAIGDAATANIADYNISSLSQLISVVGF